MRKCGAWLRNGMAWETRSLPQPLCLHARLVQLRRGRCRCLAGRALRELIGCYQTMSIERGYAALAATAGSSRVGPNGRFVEFREVAADGGAEATQLPGIRRKSSSETRVVRMTGERR